MLSLKKHPYSSENVFDENGRLKNVPRYLYNDYKSSVRDAQNFIKPNSYSGNPADYIVTTSGRKQEDIDENSYMNSIKKLINKNAKDVSMTLAEPLGNASENASEESEKMVNEIENILETPIESLEENEQLIDKIENLLSEKSKTA